MPERYTGTPKAAVTDFTSSWLSRTAREIRHTRGVAAQDIGRLAGDRRKSSLPITRVQECMKLDFPIKAWQEAVHAFGVALAEIRRRLGANGRSAIRSPKIGIPKPLPLCFPLTQPEPDLPP